jgi:phage/conjugal plasmid C-4 type zinc finger TraR family protein
VAVTDEIDRAQALEEAQREDALAAHWRRVHGDDGELDDWEHASAHWCIDCGVRIPDPRRRAVPGVTRCIDCQELAERS